MYPGGEARVGFRSRQRIIAPVHSIDPILEFVIEQSDFDNLKSTQEDVPQCDEQWSMDYVVFDFAGNEYWSPIFTVDGEILTQAVKVNVPQSGSATYDLTKFLVYHDVQGNGPSSDDLLLRAAPEPNSTYHHLMVNMVSTQRELSVSTSFI